MKYLFICHVPPIGKYQAIGKGKTVDEAEAKLKKEVFKRNTWDAKEYTPSKIEYVHQIS